MTGISEYMSNDTEQADRQAREEIVVNQTIRADDTIRPTFGSLLPSDGSGVCLRNRSFDGDLYFFTPDQSDKAWQLADHEQVNVACTSDSDFVSLSGRGRIVHDSELIDQMWNVGAQAWFEQGKDDPQLALAKVTVESAEYWTKDSSRPAALVKYAKAAVSKDQPDVGRNAEVEL